MAVKGITIDTTPASSPHIYAYDQALINNAIIGGDAVHEMFDNLLATKVSNNIVTIAPGTFSIQGHFASVVYGTTEPMTIENGTAGQKRNDLICAKFKRTVDTDVISLVVVKGTNDPSTPVDPTIVQQDLLTGGTERLFPLWRVSLDGINITTLTQMFTVQKNLNVFKDSLAPKSINGWIVQDINGFRTVTYSISRTATMSYSSASAVWVESMAYEIPLGARFSSDEEFSVSVICGQIISGQVNLYDRVNNRLYLYIFSHVNLSGTPLTLQVIITGRI